MGDSQKLETFWILTPAFILFLIGVPSLRLLYMAEEGSCVTHVKVSGHQWFWHYDFPDYEYSSYMGTLYRSSRVDNSLTLMTYSTTAILVTSADVLHSWSVPSLGAKSDAVPGRINEVAVNPDRPGLFFGQCSEICGSNHSFIDLPRM